MHTLSLNYVSNIINGTIYGEGSHDLDSIITDSRKLIAGSVFWTVGGERTHGAKFLKDSFEKGIIGAIIPDEYKDVYINELKQYHNNTWIICVNNTMDALHKLAVEWRKHFTIPVIGITGTVGKTTTKNMIGSFFKGLSHHDPLITEKSENGLLGLPLTILKLRPHHTIAILEMGISQCGEMERLSFIAKPTLCIITFLGDAHLVGYDSKKELLIKEKLIISKHALINTLNKKIVIVNSDGLEHFNDYIVSNKDIEFIVYGEKENHNYAWRGFLDNENKNFHIRHNTSIVCQFIPYILHKGFLIATIPLAIIAYLWHIDWNYYKNFCENYIAEGDSRFQIIPMHHTNTVIINDAYNANPDSFMIALDALEKMYYNKKKIFIIGDMKELGERTIKLHKMVVEKINTLHNLEKIIACGELFTHIIKKFKNLQHKTIFCHSISDILIEINRSFKPNEDKLIFIKASNSFELYKIPNIILSTHKT